MGGGGVTNTMVMPGGFGEWKPVDSDVQEMLSLVRVSLEEQGTNFSALEPKEFQTQVVAGTNYLVKCAYEGKDILVKIFAALPCRGGEVTLTSVTDL